MRITKKIIIVVLILCLTYVVATNLTAYALIWLGGQDISGNTYMTISYLLDDVAPHAEPLLIMEYENINLSPAQRNLVGISLVTALKDKNKVKAEELFEKYLESSNSDVIAQAIRDLRQLRSTKSQAKVILMAESPSIKVRIRVAEYLGYVSTDESKKVLNCMLSQDNDINVQREARVSLARIRGELK
jgi:HEAT repeat protein